MSASRAAAARARRPQDDRRDRAGAEARGSRPAREGYRADVTIFDPADFKDRATTPTRTNTRPARAPPSSSTAPSWSRTRPIPARCRAWCCDGIARPGRLNRTGSEFQSHDLPCIGTLALGGGFSGMNPSRDYRKFAEECDRLAQMPRPSSSGNSAGNGRGLEGVGGAEERNGSPDRAAAKTIGIQDSHRAEL